MSSFKELLAPHLFCKKSKIEMPQDWDENIFSMSYFFETKCSAAFVFELEEAIYACFDVEKEAPFDADIAKFSPCDKVNNKNREVDHSKIIYHLCKKKYPAFFDNVEGFLECQFDELLDAYTNYPMQYIQFDCTWVDVYLGYIFSAIDTHTVENPSDNIKKLKTMILDKYVKYKDKYTKNIQTIAEIISQGTVDKFIFYQFYSYTESLCQVIDKFNFDNLCENCKNNLTSCDECKGKKLTRKVVDWKHIKKILEPVLSAELKLNSDFIIYKKLNKHRNNLFHDKPEAIDSWGTIINSFSECLLTMLLTVMLLVDNK